MVELYKQLLGFLETLSEAHKIFIGNCRLAIGNKRSYYEQSVFGLLAARNDGASYGQFVMGLVLESGLWLVRMYVLVALTVLYCEGKKNLGEETEVMVLGLYYTKVPSLPVSFKLVTLILQNISILCSSDLIVR